MTDVQKDQILRLASAGIPESCVVHRRFVEDLEEQMHKTPDRPLRPSQTEELLRLVDLYLPQWEKSGTKCQNPDCL